jgi:CubicO group peptidase (beta-lactamase class C family)
VQWQIAGALAEAVSGKTWDELIDEIYIQPCGVESLGYHNHWSAASGFDYPSDLDPASLPSTDNPHMEGGVAIDPLDYAELLLMHLREGECDGGRVLSPEAVARAHTDRVAEYGDAGSPNTGYGMGWWVERDSTRIQDGGAYGSMPWLDTDNGYGAYLVIEADSGIGRRLYDEVVPLVEAAMGVG